MTLIDTNVLLDLVTDDANWADWSVRQLEAAAGRAEARPNPGVCTRPTPTRPVRG